MNSQISVLSVSNSDFRIISFLTFYNPAGPDAEYRAPGPRTVCCDSFEKVSH